MTGFGASAHLVLQIIQHKYPDSAIFVFARSAKQQQFAKTLGAAWVGNTVGMSPEPLQVIKDTTPAWKPVVKGLENLQSGGRLVINAIGKEVNDKEQLLQMNFKKHLWLEKEIKSVANICREDVRGFLDLADRYRLKSEVEIYSFSETNKAIRELKVGSVLGAKVLTID